MMPLAPHAQRDAATASVRNCSVYSADFVGMLSERIDICEESGTERPAEESAEQFSQPVWQLAPCGENEYATGAHKSARGAQERARRRGQLRHCPLQRHVGVELREQQQLRLVRQCFERLHRQQH